MKTKSFFLTILLLSGLISCGGETGNSDEFEREDEVLPEPETLQKVYRADLRSLDPRGDAEGQVIIRLEDDSFEVNIAMRNVNGGTHRQYIGTEKICSGVSDVYIPLDDDLDGIQNDSGQYPNGGFLRAYGYREETSRAQLVKELGREADIQFENRIVVILGTDEDENVPIACGELTPVIGSE